MTSKPKSTESKTRTRRTTPRKSAESVAPAAASVAAAPAETIEASAETIETPAETIEAPVAPPRQRSGGGATRAFLLTVIGVAFVGGAIYATEPIWYPALGAYLSRVIEKPIPDPRTATLSNRVDALEDLAQARAATGDAITDLERERVRSGERLDKLIERAGDLERALDAVKKMIAATTLPAAAKDTTESLRRFTERLKRLEGSGDALGEVTRRLSKLESDAAAEDAADAAAEDAAQDTRSVDLKELEARNRELGAAVNRLAQRLGSLSAPDGARDRDARAVAAVVLAVGQLRAALRTSGPFAKELAAVEAVAGSDTGAARAIAELRPGAGRGVATLESLRRRFDATAGEIVRASLGLEGAGWRARAGRWLASLVRVRRTAAAGGHDAEAVVARAEALLDAGDLIAATEALGALEGAAAAAADAWLTDSRARLAVERAIAVLHVFAISLLEPS